MTSTDKENFDKLRGFTEISNKDLNINDHFRYTCDKYKEYGRDCKYGIVVEIDDDGEITAQCYKPRPEYKPFELNTDNSYKNFRFYKKIKN
tara:strand:- start:2346 stop:2618 length:273 start_codon:yes stop_codon:yes gene_type:complete